MDSIMDLWRDITPELHSRLGEIAFKVWIMSITPVEMTADELVLKVPSTMHRDIVANRFSDDIRECVRERTGLDMQIKFITEEEAGGLLANDDPLEMSENQYEYTFMQMPVVTVTV